MAKIVNVEDNFLYQMETDPDWLSSLIHCDYPREKAVDQIRAQSVSRQTNTQ